MPIGGENGKTLLETSEGKPLCDHCASFQPPATTVDVVFFLNWYCIFQEVESLQPGFRRAEGDSDLSVGGLSSAVQAALPSGCSPCPCRLREKQQRTWAFGGRPRECNGLNNWNEVVGYFEIMFRHDHNRILDLLS